MLKKVAEADDIILAFEINKTVYTSSKVTALLKNNSKTQSFFEFSSKYFDDQFFIYFHYSVL